MLSRGKNRKIQYKHTHTMVCCGHSPFFGFGLFFLILSLLLDVAGVASPFWVFGKNNLGLDFAMGLWEICYKGSIEGHEISGCDDIENSTAPDWLKAVRAFGLLGIILLSIAIFSAFVKICLKNKSFILIIAILMAVMSTVCNIVSVIIFAVKYKDFIEHISDQMSNYHFSFVSCVICIPISGLAVLCMMIEVFKRSTYSLI